MEGTSQCGDGVRLGDNSTERSGGVTDGRIMWEREATIKDGRVGKGEASLKVKVRRI